MKNNAMFICFGDKVTCCDHQKRLVEEIVRLSEACDLYEKATKTLCTCETASGCCHCDYIIKARDLIANAHQEN